MERLIEGFIIWRYCNVALAWGDWQSYALAYDKNPNDRALERWTKLYSYLGYEPVPKHIWIEAGGYGLPYEQYLCKVSLASNP